MHQQYPNNAAPPPASPYAPSLRPSRRPPLFCHSPPNALIPLHPSSFWPVQVRVLAGMEMAGMAVDVNKLKAQSKGLVTREAQLRHRIKKVGPCILRAPAFQIENQSITQAFRSASSCILALPEHVSSCYTLSPSCTSYAPWHASFIYAQFKFSKICALQGIPSHPRPQSSTSCMHSTSCFAIFA